MDQEPASGRQRTSSQTTPKVEVADSQQTQMAIPDVTADSFHTNHDRTLPADEGSPTESGSEHGDDTVQGHMPNDEEVEADTSKKIDAVSDDPREPIDKFLWTDFVIDYSKKIKAIEETEWHLRQDFKKLVNVL